MPKPKISGPFLRFAAAGGKRRYNYFSTNKNKDKEWTLKNNIGGSSAPLRLIIKGGCLFSFTAGIFLLFLPYASLSFPAVYFQPPFVFAFIIRGPLFFSFLRLSFGPLKIYAAPFLSSPKISAVTIIPPAGSSNRKIK